MESYFIFSFIFSVDYYIADSNDSIKYTSIVLNWKVYNLEQKNTINDNCSLTQVSDNHKAICRSIPHFAVLRLFRILFHVTFLRIQLFP